MLLSLVKNTYRIKHQIHIQSIHKNLTRYATNQTVSSFNEFHICFHHPWCLKYNTYLIEKVHNLQDHFNEIEKDHFNLIEQGFFELAAMNGYLFTRPNLVYSEKNYNVTKCKNLLERLKTDGNELTFLQEPSCDNNVMAAVELNKKNNNTDYLMKVLTDL
jgi:hypothetical protein